MNNKETNARTNCTVLLLTCDKNIDIARGAVGLFNRFWVDCPFEKYVMTETVDPKFSGFNSLLINENNWSDRVKSALKCIKSDYVLLFLDDFWLEEKVDSRGISELLEILQVHPEVLNASFSKMPGLSDERIATHYLIRKPNRYCLVNWQAGVWKRMGLMSLLVSGENPWESEIFGTHRALKYKKNVFLSIDSSKNSPFVYNNGWLVVRGSWNLSELKRLKSKLNISVDVGKHPVTEKSVIPGTFFQKVKTKCKIYRHYIKTLLFYKKIQEVL